MGTPPASSSDPASYVPPATATGVQGDWDRVHVERIEMERAVPPVLLACVRASLFLGRLLPVDVDVELEVGSETGAALGDSVKERMWSAHSYQNGSYLFEAHVPDAKLAVARNVSVHVRPRDGVHEGRSLVTITPSSELRRVASPDPLTVRNPASPWDRGTTAAEPPRATDDLGP